MLERRIRSLLPTLLVFELCARPVASRAQWDVQAFGVGQLTQPFDVKVGQARNDGLNRVYVTERNGNVMEWTHAAGGWSNTLVYAGVTNLASLAIGDARGDGSNRLYFTEFVATKNGALYEAEWTGTNWLVTKRDDTYQSFCIFIGAGRNDGHPRLYVGSFGNSAGAGKGLWEYTYATGGWQKAQLHAAGMEGSAAVADIRNDGTNRVLANTTNALDEYTWSGSGYTGSAIDGSASLHPDPVAVGLTHNDGSNRVVINSGQGKIEYSFADGSWNKRIFDVTVQRGDIMVARLKADGLYRVYATHTSKNWGSPTLPKGPVREFAWQDSNGAYTSAMVVDGVTGATAKLDAGNGRNDRVARLYAPDYGVGRILEITSTNPLLYAVPDAGLAIAGLDAVGGAVRLALTNLTGQCEYRVQCAPAPDAPWSNAGGFTAVAPRATWTNGLDQESAFYRVLGLPQRDP